LPDELTVVVAVAPPVNFTVVPADRVVGVMLPDMVQVGATAEVNVTPVMFEPETLTPWLEGVNTKPDAVGVTV